MKRTFGNWITRLLRGGHTLTDAEHRLLCLLIGELPPHLRETVERQFQSYNLAQREIDRRALNFYRVRLGSGGVLPVAPRLTSKLDVAPLVRITATVEGEIEPIDASLEVQLRRRAKCWPCAKITRVELPSPHHLYWPTLTSRSIRFSIPTATRW